MKVKPRLARLEAAIPTGCGACGAWWDTVLSDDFGATQRPDRCPACGRLVPIRTMIHIVGIPLDAV